jgi:hypothetical protein
MTYAVRVELAGPSSLNGPLRARSEEIANEVRALSLSLDGRDVWVEKVVVATTPLTGRPVLEADGVAGEIGQVLADLKADVSMLASGDGSRIPSLAALRSQLRAASSADLGDVLDDAEIALALDDAAELLATLLSREEIENAH